jgi:ribosomal protein S20
MLISGLQSSSLFSELATSSTSSTSSSSASSGNSFDSALTSLMAAIKSGDSTDAKKYLTEVEKLAPSNADSNSPLGEFLSSVSTALSDNNIAGAQSALTTLETYATPSTTAASSTTDTSSTSSSDSATSALTQDVLSLFSAINSGDLTSAQTAYDKVTSLLDTASSSSSTSSASSNNSTSTASFTSLLKEIGSALGSGNVNTAQTALDNFLASLSAGSLVSASA